MQRFRNLILLILLTGLFGAVQSARAQSAMITNTKVNYIFGEQITFEAKIQTDIPVDSVTLFFQFSSDPKTVLGEAFVNERGEIFYVHDTIEQFVQAFTQIDYWYRVELENGEVLTSQVFSFEYEDNRFHWQVLESEPFIVHWYEGDIPLAQFILDTAHLGMTKIQDMIQAPPPEKIDIYIYANSEDYQFAKGLLGQRWIGGHADPESGFIFVSLPASPEQRLEVERKIPHEVAHILLFHAAGEGFWDLPTWLNEGIASNNELYPNPDYRFLLTSARESNGLIPMTSLCNPFPRDASGILLSYAQSASFVHYLHQNYGDAGIQAIVNQYAGGAGCELGTQVSPIGKPLSQLESEWQSSSFTQAAPELNVNESLFWMVVMVFLMIGPITVIIFGPRRRVEGKSAQI